MTLDVRYRFANKGLGTDQRLDVVSFRGQEGVSRLYEFVIDFKSTTTELDLDAILAARGTLTLEAGGATRDIHGVLSHFEELDQADALTLYRAVLVPQLWQLSLYRTNEVYLGQSVPETLKAVLEEGGFTAADYELRLQRSYRTWPFRCQFNETHLDFLSRLMEHEGIYYYFVQEAEREKLVICDHLQAQDDLPGADVRYSPPSGLDVLHREDTIHSLVCRQSRLPHKLVLRDYNDDNPSVDIKGEAEVDAKGIGEVYLFGDNIESAEEGNELAAIRAEEIRAGKRVFHGEGTVVRLAPGFNFALAEHFRAGFNQKYLLTAIEHEGYVPGLVTAADAERAGYQNSFTAIPAEVQFRPERKTPKSRFFGSLNAIIDAAGDGKYAEVDELGRYKVIILFDRVRKQEGKASHWVRMAQPFAGQDEGMHFPLRKGTEVLLTFVGGDPDRPVISGAVPNARHPSVVTADTSTRNRIQTSAGNYLEMEDREDSRRIKLYSPHKDTYLHIGAPNHAGEGIVMLTRGLERKEIAGGQRITVTVDGNEQETATENSDANTTAGGSGADGNVIDDLALTTFKLCNPSTGRVVTSNLPAGVNADGTFTEAAELSGKWLFERRVGDKYTWTSGSEFNYGGGHVFNFGDGGYEETHATEEPTASESFSIPSSMSGAVGYNPYNPETGEGGGFVEKLWGDTYSYQSGNNYAWGDTKDYAFGNGYAENHVSGAGPINGDYDHDDYSGRSVTINADSALVEKTIGDTYSYQDGNSLSIMNGDSEEKVWGDSWSEVHGKTNEHYIGRTEAMYVAGNASFNFSGSIDLTIGLSSENFLGGIVETSFAGKLEVELGIKKEVVVAKFETEALKLGQSAVNAQTNGTTAQTTGTQVNTSGTTVQNSGANVSNSSATVSTSAATVVNSGVTVVP